MSQENGVSNEVPAKPEGPNEKVKQLKTYALAAYVLYFLSYLTGLTAIVGLIIAIIKLPESKGTYLESHFQLLIRVFVWGLIISLVGAVLSFIGIGLIVLVVGFIWLLYYLVIGVIRLTNDEPAPRIFWFGQ